MDSRKLNSEGPEEGVDIFNLDFLFDIPDITEGLNILADRLVTFSRNMIEELSRLDEALQNKRETLPVEVSYASILPVVYLSDTQEYSTVSRGLSVLPDFSDFPEISSGDEYFFI